MKAFIGKYYTTLEKAFEAYEKLSPEQKKRHSVVGVGDQYFIVSNDQIKAVNSKK